jgi:uncharacterized DUF497 family protein
MVTWDEKKRKQVIEDHGIDFGKISDVFQDPFAIIEEDLDHSDVEERWVAIAKSSEYGLLGVVYTFRHDEIRLITARRAEKWMVRIYEKQRDRS